MHRSAIAIALLAATATALPAAAKDLLRVSTMQGTTMRGTTVTRPATGCEAFGPGFQKVAGSDTCIRVGGSVRLETGISTGGASFWPGARQ